VQYFAAMGVVPKFTDHPGNRKNQPLDTTSYGAPEPIVLELLQRHKRSSQGPVRVLDVGCGRGSRVAWLCEQGWDAWGYDVVPAYIASGRPFFDRRGWGGERLRLITADGDGVPFDDAAFDIVLSHMVIEHVADLESFVAGVARVTKLGGVGLHAFPAAFRPIEPHLHQPFVHWLPKGRIRRAAITAAVRTGLGVDYFSELGVTTKAEIYATFSETETFYRLRRTVARTFAAHGLEVDLREVPERKMQYKLGPYFPGHALPLAALAYSLFMRSYVATVKR
jgi:SAM-dependent methyltransferase